MKKLFLILIFAMAFNAMSYAQSFYTRLGVAVGPGIANNLDMLYSYSNDGSNRMVTVMPLGLGRGFTGTAAFGYNPSRYIGLEFGISQFLGFPKIADSVVRLPGGTSGEVRVTGTMLSLLPALVIRPGLGDVDPYARVGLILGIRPTINATAEVTNSSTNPPQDAEAIRHFYGGVAVGLNAALGISWTVSDLVSLYAEGSFSSISYSPRYSEVVKYDINGVDQLPTMTIKQKETEYYSNINPDEVIPDTSPDKELRKSLPFSNASIALGIIFKF